MPAREILTYPHPKLREIATEVEDFTAPEFQTELADLIATLEAAPGCVGVAAPQVGWLARVVVIDCSRGRKPPAEHHGRVVMCNPVILNWSGMEVAREGCLSLPDYTGNVMRAATVTVRYQERTATEHTLTLTGFEARVLQHELDHLEGKLFVDRVVSRKADLFPRKSYL